MGNSSEWVYKTKEDFRPDLIINWFKSHRNRIEGFKSLEDFQKWYSETISDKECHYCKLTERECQEIVHKGIVFGKRLAINGIFNNPRGKNRGFWLEIDRKHPYNPEAITEQSKYSPECVPCCYFCNNDKSDAFSHEQYIELINGSNRAAYFRKLLNK